MFWFGGNGEEEERGREVFEREKSWAEEKKKRRPSSSSSASNEDKKKAIKSILTPLSLSLSTSLAHCVVLPQRSTPSSTMKAPLGEDAEAEAEVDAAARRGSEEAMVVEPTFAFIVVVVAPPAAAPPALPIPAISAGGGPGIRRALDVTEERACAREKWRRREAMVAMMLRKEGLRVETKSRRKRCFLSEFAFFSSLLTAEFFLLLSNKGKQRKATSSPSFDRCPRCASAALLSLAAAARAQRRAEQQRSLCAAILQSPIDESALRL